MAKKNAAKRATTKKVPKKTVTRKKGLRKTRVKKKTSPKNKTAVRKKGPQRKPIAGIIEFNEMKPVFDGIESVTPFVKPFPAFEDVFGEPMLLHRKHFLPLVSVNAAVVHDDLDFWLHFVTPIEPLLEGNVGDWTGEYHDFYNQVGRVAFQFSDGRYSFTGDPNFFAYESGAIFAGFPNREDEIEQDYRDRIALYEVNRQRFLQYGRIPWNAEAQWKPGSRGPLVKQLGGDVAFGNWGAEIPRNRSGKPFRFIGEVQGFSYTARAADGILLFYDPDEQIALLVFDWT
jgi:hypothetical protein